MNFSNRNKAGNKRWAYEELREMSKSLRDKAIELDDAIQGLVVAEEKNYCNYGNCEIEIPKEQLYYTEECGIADNQ